MMIGQEEDELKFVPDDETQAKLIDSLRGKRMEEATSRVMATLRIGDFSISGESTEFIVDEYFDDEDLDVHKMQASLRGRRKGGSITVTIKRVLGIELGQFKRQERSRVVSEEDYRYLVDEGFRSIINAELPDLKGQRLRKVLCVRNTRTNVMVDRGEENYCLSFDSFEYVNAKNGDTSALQMEIELEALSDLARKKLSNIRRDLIPILQTFSYATESKYDRGLEQFSLLGPSWWHRVTNWNTSKKLTWIGIVLAILGLIVTILFRVF